MKLGFFQAVSIIVTVMISHIILDMPNQLISATGSSTILNLIFVFAISFIIFMIAYKILKQFPDSDIIDICEYSFGSKIKNVFSIFTCIYLLVISAFIIRIFSESLILIYFPDINIEVIILFFIAITVILNILGFKTIARVCELILPTILIAMVVIFAGNLPDFVYQRAYPILGYGAYETFVSGLR